MRGRAGNEEPEQMQGVNGGYQVPYQIEAAINRGNFTPSKWGAMGQFITKCNLDGNQKWD